MFIELYTIRCDIIKSYLYISKSRKEVIKVCEELEKYYKEKYLVFYHFTMYNRRVVVRDYREYLMIIRIMLEDLFIERAMKILEEKMNLLILEDLRKLSRKNCNLQIGNKYRYYLESIKLISPQEEMTREKLIKYLEYILVHKQYISLDANHKEDVKEKYDKLVKERNIEMKYKRMAININHDAYRFLIDRSGNYENKQYQVGRFKKLLHEDNFKKLFKEDIHLAINLMPVLACYAR